MRLIIFFALIISCFVLSAGGHSNSGMALPRADIYALDNDNTLWRWRACNGFGFRRELQIRGVVGQVIGIDFRPADGLLYALSDTGGIYTIDTDSSGVGRAKLISALTVNFAGGVQSLADFNPVANALRLIGSNDQNHAVVNSGGNLNLAVAQTALVYAPGDVNFGINPNITGGAYTNNVAGATTTIFYAVDFNADSLVTIAPPLVGAGSSNTGGGQLQTIGRLTNAQGQTLNVTPTADLDIYTVGGQNYLIGASGRLLFTIDLNQINRNLPLGQTQPVIVRTLSITDGGFIDLAVGPPRKCGR